MPRLARRSAALAVAVLTLCAAPALGSMRSFRVPSGKIGCLYSSSGGPGAFIRCDVLTLNDVGFVVRTKGKGRRVRVTDTVANPKAKVLRYGSVRNFGPFRCRSRRSGLTCRTRANGHGFTLSRRRQRVF
jgi:hypothetical protein